MEVAIEERSFGTGRSWAADLAPAEFLQACRLLNVGTGSTLYFTTLASYVAYLPVPVMFSTRTAGVL